MRQAGRQWRFGFWALAFLWLPAGLVAGAALRFGIEPTTFMVMESLIPVIPCGLPLALGCRRLWRLGYHRVAWTAGLVLGVVTVATTLVAGLLGPIAIVVCTTVSSLPVWAVAWWLGRRS